MTLLRQLLLVPLLAPLLAMLLIGAINPRPMLSLRLLTWQTPSLPLGAWLMLASGGGGLLSALGSALALRAAQPTPLRRRLRRPGGDTWDPAQQPAAPIWPEAMASAGPTRSAADPSPTVAVPYRVIRRGHSASRQERPAPASAGMEQSGAADDGWDQPLNDAW